MTTVETTQSGRDYPSDSQDLIQPSLELIAETD